LKILYIIQFEYKNEVQVTSFIKLELKAGASLVISDSDNVVMKYTIFLAQMMSSLRSNQFTCCSLLFIFMTAHKVVT